jgi:trans-aconitate 2-methyltransferase
VSGVSAEWDALAYDNLAELPHDDWAEQVLGRLDLTGTERVLDAGCGTGRLLAMLRERHHGLDLVGVDSSGPMLDKARRNFDEDIQLIEADLLDLELPEPVDVVVSNAVFHWVPDHRHLFEHLFGVLRPGGVLEAQCGGDGNVAEVQRAAEALSGDERFAPYLRTERRPWNYASVGDTKLRLTRAGFEDVRVWLEPWPVRPSEPGRYLATVVLPWHLTRLPAGLHDEFVDAIMGSSPRPFVVNYVRLNISARRPE